MKIGIITHVPKSNYGCILQNWAMQKILQDMGHESVTIKFKRESIYKNLKKNSLTIAKYIIKYIIFYPTRNLDKLPWNSSPYTYMRHFVRSHILQTKWMYKITDKSLNNSHIEAIIVGSDQVWRPKYNIGVLNTMFCQNIRSNCIPCIAYAASFGCSEWEYTEAQTKMAAQNIEKFKAVSVREESGVGLCRQYLKTDAILVLDPTLLISVEEYKKLIPMDLCSVIPTGCVLVYMLDMTEKKQHFVDNVCTKLNKRPYYIREKDVNGEYASVEKWLAAFYYSDFIITDSFHGTAFSINFHKRFISIINRDRGADRFNSLLGMFRLESQAIDENKLDEYCIDKVNKIDWAEVDGLLEYYRKDSIKFLNKSLNLTT